MEQNDLTSEEIQKIQAKAEKDIDLMKLGEYLRDNLVPFEYNAKKYRVRILDRKEKEELYKFKIRRYVELLKDKTYTLENDLIKVYKERGIDIEKMTQDFIDLEKEEQGVNFKLGEALANKSSEVECNAWKEQIEDIRRKKFQITIQKTHLLAFSLEHQLMINLYEYKTFLGLEILEGENWVKVFKTFDEFKACEDDVLINEASSATTLIQND
jgi:hypothetical protein